MRKLGYACLILVGSWLFAQLLIKVAESFMKLAQVMTVM
jgi:hypothetical protein